MLPSARDVCLRLGRSISSSPDRRSSVFLGIHQRPHTSPRYVYEGFFSWWSQISGSDRQNNEHIRENRTKNRTNIRQNRILQKPPNIYFFILLELYWIIRLNISVLILQNNQTELLSWCLWVCFKNIKCLPQKMLGTLISMFTCLLYTSDAADE